MAEIQVPHDGGLFVSQHAIERAIAALTESHSGAIIERSIGNELRRIEAAIMPTRLIGTSRLSIIANCIDEAILELTEARQK